MALRPNSPAGAAAEDPNVQVMTRGPVHEAYAMPVTQGQAAAGIVVPREAAGTGRRSSARHEAG